MGFARIIFELAAPIMESQSQQGVCIQVISTPDNVNLLDLKSLKALQKKVRQEINPINGDWLSEVVGACKVSLEQFCL